jgi:hypothetical protein
MEKTEIILQADGSFVERLVSERTLNVGQSVLDTLTENINRQIRNVFNLPGWGFVHANVGLNDTLWSIAIDRIPLHARFKLINQVLVPMFASTTDIEMPLVWQVPAGVKVVFAVLTKQEDDIVIVEGNWLFACDADKRGYRLPLPNLHDDCRICTGQFEGDQENAFECVKASLEQFNQSKWNADLMRTSEQSQKFFRFQPTKETFETLPILGENWTALCNKVSTALWERVVT